MIMNMKMLDSSTIICYIYIVIKETLNDNWNWGES